MYSHTQLKIVLPDGRKLAKEFLQGQDVEWVKHYVSEELDCNRNDFVISSTRLRNCSSTRNT